MSKKVLPPHRLTSVFTTLTFVEKNYRVRSMPSRHKKNEFIDSDGTARRKHAERYGQAKQRLHIDK